MCLLAPGPIRDEKGVSRVEVVQAKPDLVLGTALNELEIRSGKGVLWSQQASSRVPIKGRLSWPIAAMQPQQELELAMRPQGSAGSDWAVVRLVGASKEVMALTAEELKATSHGRAKLLQTLEKAAQRGDAATAVALLWEESAVSPPEVNILRQETLGGCH